MGNFTVDPAKVRSAATTLHDTVAPAYGVSATTVDTGGQIDEPKFGLALIFLAAAYDQRRDFVMKDLQGAQSVMNSIAERLKTTADQYDRAENLNASGFDGPGQEGESYGSALVGDLTALPIALVAGGIELGVILACAGTLETCAGLCPAFIPAAIAIPLFICKIPSIFQAGNALSQEGEHIKSVLNEAFSLACDTAKSDWTGEGAANFALMDIKIKGHLDQLGEYVKTLGTAMTTIAGVLTALWVGLIAVAAPFLIWLIAMRIAEASPPWLQDAVLEPIIEATGTIMSLGILTTLAGIESAGAAVAAALSGVAGPLLNVLSPPDGGKSGTPDMQEFHVDQNYKTPL